MGGILFSVDPGHGGTGLAVFRPGLEPSLELYDTCILTATTPADWQLRNDKLVMLFESKLRGWRTDLVEANKLAIGGGMRCTVAIEYPAFMQRGIVSSQRGDITKLTFLVGRYAQVASSLGMHYKLVPVNDWKGQMTKDAVRARLRRIYDTEQLPFKSHAEDAVGIGLWVMGKFTAT
jgi:hypothetical protein